MGRVRGQWEGPQWDGQAWLLPGVQGSGGSLQGELAAPWGVTGWAPRLRAGPGQAGRLRASQGEGEMEPPTQLSPPLRAPSCTYSIPCVSRDCPHHLPVTYEHLVGCPLGIRAHHPTSQTLVWGLLYIHFIFHFVQRNILFKSVF